MQRRALLLSGGAFAVTSLTPVPGKAAAPPGAGALTAPWAGPYGGTPPFDRVAIADFKAALETAMAEELAEVAAIAGNRSPPTFANTLAAYERSGRMRERVSTVYGVWSATLSTPEMRAVETEMAPRLAAHSDRILQNPQLFARLEAVHGAASYADLTPEQARLTWYYWNSFVRSGARLSPADKARVAAINGELAGLFSRFSQNLLHDEQSVLMLSNPSDVAGLPPDLLAAFSAAGGQSGRWGVANTRSAVDPFLTYATRRDLREKVWRAYYSRGDNGDASDNNAIIRSILRLRAERAKLRGYPTHAHWRLENAMAKTPDAAMALMMRVWPSAIARVKEEVAEMQAIADRERAGIIIAPWDYRYYAEKVRAARYDLDMNAVKPYLQLEKLREGMFWMAGELYGFTFAPASHVAVAHPDIRVWAVSRDGAHVGLWYFDPYARPGKRSGAWMSAYRVHESFDGAVPTLVSNNANFVKGAPGEPVLISWDDAETLFHEFGHALHGLNSAVAYPALSATRVARDYVEFPSQVHEHWLPTPAVLQRFALHHQTGEPIPTALTDKIAAARTFRQGFDVTEYLAAAIVDMRLHLAGDVDIDPDAFEREALADLGMPSELPMRHRLPQFAHLFASDGYSAGYYSYLWSEVLALDCFEAFVEAGDPFDKATARRLRETVLKVGNSIDPADQYRAFRGRDADVSAYLRDKGFPS
ncbi:M3 family metallopeptidase (plasmid) [Brevundimonas staleyi]|uniref:M3 family metallopeptidase n=1 Tax=Brevundimonas staleyi TaxID=74326 RepID=A0ABW0FND3_9CAUL